MNRDILIQLAAIIAAIGMAIFFTPRNKIREALVIFLFKLFATWILGLFVVEYRLIDYPVRFFPYSTRTSFAFEYLIYPAICVVFNLHFPETKSYFRRFMHYFYFCTVMTVIEGTVEKYTDIITYRHWNLYITWGTLFITFFFSRIFYLWFFRKKSGPRAIS